jgi:hypothetical protein
MVNPSSDPVETRHDCADHLVISDRDEKQLWLNGEFPANHGCRLIPWRIIPKDIAP